MENHSNRLQLLGGRCAESGATRIPERALNFTEIYLPDFLAAILRDWEKRFEAKLLKSSLDAPLICRYLGGRKPFAGNHLQSAR